MLIVGVMSGTSCDGVDVVLAEFSDEDNNTSCIIAAKTTNYPSYIKIPLMKVIADQATAISDISQLDAQLGLFYAEVINETLASNDINHSIVTAIGLHGQTVCHQPPSDGAQLKPNTMQLGSAAITAQKTQITTVANFRQMDVAYGGQGAPLAPVLHQDIFKRTGKVVAVLNLGGIANITILNGKVLNGAEVLGFDTGPASCLMDAYIQAEHNLPFDDSGQWAQQGQIDQALLKDFLGDDYFKQMYPKSTGRELFNLNWLQQHLKGKNTVATDVQRTLLQLTVESIALGLQLTDIEVDQMVVCGGGIHNQFLIQQLQARLACKVNSSADWGINPDYVEAMLMAWLAKQNIERVNLDLKSITGCHTPHIYGVQYEP